MTTILLLWLASAGVMIKEHASSSPTLEEREAVKEMERTEEADLKTLIKG